jgi:hypothetical protein
MKRLLLASFALIAVCTAPTAASAQTTQRFEQWLSMPMTLNLSDSAPGFQLWLDEHVRRGPGQTVHITRPGIGYRITPWAAVYLGYAWVPVFVDAPQDVINEHRIWEQVIFNFAVPGARLDIQLRTRFEQRFSEQGDDVGLRLRQFGRLLYHFTADGPFGLVLWDEVFIPLTDTDWGQQASFQQNRLFFGPSVDIPRLGRLEMGYMWNFLNNPHPAQDVNAHVFYIQLLVML